MKPDPDEVLADLQNMDGVLWLHILGQQHWQYDELPFWVLLNDEAQFPKAVEFLQSKLRNLNDASEAIVTVAFIIYRGRTELSLGYFEGKEFFDLKSESIEISPMERTRTPSVFDAQYPNEAWSIEIRD